MRPSSGLDRLPFGRLGSDDARDPIRHAPTAGRAQRPRATRRYLWVWTLNNLHKPGQPFFAFPIRSRSGMWTSRG